MVEPILLYIGTSKNKEIRGSGVRTLHWSGKSKWVKLKKPVAKKNLKVAYDKKSKDKPGTKTYWGLGDNGTHWGTKFPRTAQRTIEGVVETVDVRVYVKGATIFQRTSALKALRPSKMRKLVYTGKNNSYYYQLQYKDKPTYQTVYSRFVDGTSYINFWDYYVDDSGAVIPTDGHLMHPQVCSITYFDVNKNFDTSASNNNDGRDKKGTLVMTKVRCNLVELELEWAGLSAEDGDDLLDTLNPTKGHPYLVVQYVDPATGKAKNCTCTASDRAVEKYSNGYYKKIAVTLTEV